MNKPTSSLRNAGSRGLSLIEMMVAVTVLGTLVALAAPSFARIGERYKVDSVQADLVTALQSARAEAVNQGRTVTLRRLAGCPEATHPADWRCGWESFIDRNRNRTRDPDDTLLSSHGPVRGHQILLEGPRDDSLAYSALGRSDVATQGLRITPDRSTTAGTTVGTGLRRLCIEFGGSRPDRPAPGRPVRQAQQRPVGRPAGQWRQQRP